MNMRQKVFLVIAILLTMMTQGAWATGELNGAFTINASGDRVVFSKGNLQATYDGTSWSWGFAKNQWDFIGQAVANTSLIGYDNLAGGTILLDVKLSIRHALRHGPLQ